jgi:hypothetical protein
LALTSFFNIFKGGLTVGVQPAWGLVNRRCEEVRVNYHRNGGNNLL